MTDPTLSERELLLAYIFVEIQSQRDEILKTLKWNYWKGSYQDANAALAKWRASREATR